MGFMKRHMRLVIAVTLALAAVGFLAFRPDKLIVDDAVSETLEEAFVTDQNTTVPPPRDQPTTIAPEPTIPDPGTTLPQPEGPVTINAGSFYGIDHSASGTATVYRQGDRYVLRFEDDTDIQNGPDLFVWLLPADDYTGSATTGYLDLGKLKGNVGGQNYELPPEFDPEVHRTVLIWCLRFRVPFAAAPLG